MKRLLIVLALLLVAGVAWGQTVYVTDATIAWDAPTGYVDGSPFLPTDVVEFEVYRQDKAALLPLESLGTTGALTFYTVLPNDRTKYVYIVRTMLTTDEGQTTLYSEYAYSPFDLRHPSTVNPGAPGGIRWQF